MKRIKLISRIFRDFNAQTTIYVRTWMTKLEKSQKWSKNAKSTWLLTLSNLEALFTICLQTKQRKLRKKSKVLERKFWENICFKVSFWNIRNSIRFYANRFGFTNRLRYFIYGSWLVLKLMLRLKMKMGVNPLIRVRKKRAAALYNISYLNSHLLVQL